MSAALRKYDLSELHSLQDQTARDIADAIVNGMSPSALAVNMYRELRAEGDRRNAELSAWINDGAPL